MAASTTISRKTFTVHECWQLYDLLGSKQSFVHSSYTLIDWFSVTSNWKCSRCSYLRNSRRTKSLRFGFCHTANSIDDLLLYISTLCTYVYTNVSFIRNDVMFQASINKSYCDHC